MRVHLWNILLHPVLCIFLSPSFVSHDMSIGIYILRCQRKWSVGMASIRRRKRGFQVAIVTIVLLSLAPFLVMVISRDPSLSPMADGQDQDSNVEVGQRQDVEDYHKPERVVHHNKVSTTSSTLGMY